MLILMDGPGNGTKDIVKRSAGDLTVVGDWEAISPAGHGFPAGEQRGNPEIQANG